MTRPGRDWKRRQTSCSILLGVAFATVANAASAQTPPAPPAPAAPPAIASTAVPLDPPFLTACEAEPVLKHLTAAYNKGDWAAFQADARALLDALHRPKPASDKTAKTLPIRQVPAECLYGNLSTPVAAALNYATRYVVLVWVGSSALGRTQVMRAVVHSPLPEPSSADLPGVTGFTEVFLASSLDARTVSLYTSTREKDPFVEQPPDFIKAIFNPLAATIAGIKGACSRPPERVSMTAARGHRVWRRHADSSRLGPRADEIQGPRAAGRLPGCGRDRRDHPVVRRGGPFRSGACSSIVAGD